MNFRDRLAQALKVQTRVHVIENFLSPEQCREVIEMAERQTYTPAEINNGKDGWVNENVRRVGVCSITEEDFSMQPVLDLASKLFEVTVLPSKARTQILKYEGGGHYKAHSDAVNIVPLPDGSWRAERVHDRDVSVVLYLNDDFEGGEFEFSHSHQIVKPQPGTLILFPSDWRHEHRVAEVTSGTRWALVNWYASTPHLVPESETVSTGGVNYYNNKMR